MEVSSLSVPVSEPSELLAARRAAVHCAQRIQFDETDTGRAVLAVLLPVIVCCCGGFLCIMMLGGFGALMHANQ